jgi:hypothetical protein
VVRGGVSEGRPRSGVARRDAQQGPAFVDLDADVEAAHQIVHEAGGMLVASCEDCVVSVLSRNLTLAGVNALGVELSRLVERYGSARYFSVVTEGRVREQPGARSAMTFVLNKHTKQLRRAAIVVEGTGFVVTAVRSVITGIHMASSATHPLRVFSTVDPALAWLEDGKVVGEPKTSALGACMAALRARFP